MEWVITGGWRRVANSIMETARRSTPNASPTSDREAKDWDWWRQVGRLDETSGDLQDGCRPTAVLWDLASQVCFISRYKLQQTVLKCCSVIPCWNSSHTCINMRRCTQSWFCFVDTHRGHRCSCRVWKRCQLKVGSMQIQILMLTYSNVPCVCSCFSVGNKSYHW